MQKCLITDLFPTPEILRKHLFIDLEKQQVIRVSDGKILTQHLTTTRKNKEKEYRIVIFFANKKYYNLRVHRLFFYWHHGYLPPLVDHKDTNPQNNSIENLRELDKIGNARNSNKKIRKNCSSQYKGVSKQRNKWVARIKLNGQKEIRIGCYDKEDDAGQAYNDKIRELGIEEVSVLNDTPQERARKNNQFDSLPEEMNHIKVLFQDVEPLVDLK